MFKISNKNTRKRCEICSKLTIKTSDLRRSGAFIVNFKYISHFFLVFYCWLWTSKCKRGCKSLQFAWKRNIWREYRDELGYSDLRMSSVEDLFSFHNYSVDKGRHLNVRKTFRRRPRRLLNVLCTFNLCTVSTGLVICKKYLNLEFGNFISLN